MRRNLRSITLATTLLLALSATSATAAPRHERSGREAWTKVVESLRSLVGGFWDFYGGFVDPNGDDGDGDGG